MFKKLTKSNNLVSELLAFRSLLCMCFENHPQIGFGKNAFCIG